MHGKKLVNIVYLCLYPFQRFSLVFRYIEKIVNKKKLELLSDENK